MTKRRRQGQARQWWTIPALLCLSVLGAPAGAHAADQDVVDYLRCQTSPTALFHFDNVGSGNAHGRPMFSARGGDSGYPDSQFTITGADWGKKQLHANSRLGGAVLSLNTWPEAQQATTVRASLPHATRLQFTLLSVDSSRERLHVTGTNQAAQVNTSISAREDRMDVWFDQPVDSVVISQEHRDASRWEMTRMLGCQTADVVLSSEGVSAPRPVESTDRVWYTFPLRLKVKNTGQPADMPLRPHVELDLGSLVERNGPQGRVERITGDGGSGPACTPMPAAMLTSDELMAPGDDLAGGEFCQVYYRVDVSFPAHDLPFTKYAVARLHSTDRDGGRTLDVSNNATELPDKHDRGYSPTPLVFLPLPAAD